MVTRAATTTSWTMIRMRVGIVLRIMDIMTFANAVITYRKNADKGTQDNSRCGNAVKADATGFHGGNLAVA